MLAYMLPPTAPHAQRAEEVREGGPYFIACSDGQTRGPFGGADVVRSAFTSIKAEHPQIAAE